MEDRLKFIYQNYSRATSFREYWYAFENYLDWCFPRLSETEPLRKRFQRFETYLQSVLVHDVFLSRLFALDEAKSLAELQPRIFREHTGATSTSAHETFASDYARYARGQKPQEPIARLLYLLYTVRCNDQHGQKILPEEWEEIRRRNALVFSLTVPLLAILDELIMTFFVATGIFSYGTLQNLVTTKELPFVVEALPGMKIQGQLFDLGRFPGWRYETRGWVHGAILEAPLQFRNKFVQHCDTLEGEAFERRLVIADNEDENIQHMAWAYHYRSQTNVSQRLQDGRWKGSTNLTV